MREKLDKIKKEVEEQLAKIGSLEALKNLEIKYLGRKGEFTQILKSLKDLSDKEKKEIGSLANRIKNDLIREFESVKDKIQGKSLGASSADITLPGEKLKQGHLNPLTIVTNELIDLFSSMGFAILDGPLLESDYYCFEALNIPRSHPARDMQDTFYIDKKNKDNEFDLVMRTHTSPVQVRALQKYGAPFRGVVPGRVFRNENIDACHEHTFDQMEGLMVDRDINIGNLIAVLQELLNGILKSK